MSAFCFDNLDPSTRLPSPPRKEKAPLHLILSNRRDFAIAVRVQSLE